MSLRIAAVIFTVAFFVACKGADSPSADPAKEGEACAVGSRTTRSCAEGLHCAPKPYTPVPEGKGPESPSPEGGSCGGVAGFHCAEGLACHVDDDKQLVADAMGTCLRAYACVK